MATETRGGNGRPDRNPTLFYQKEKGPKLAKALTEGALEEMFTRKSLTPEQARRIDRVNEAAKVLARTIREAAPDCSDVRAAIRKARESAMLANQAVATGGRF